MPMITPRTATAMALALGISAPASAIAQDVDTADLPECMEMVTLPCVTATGALVEDREQLDIYLDAFPEEAAAAAERAAQEAAEALDDVAPPDADAPEADPVEAEDVLEGDPPEPDVVPESEVPEAEVEAAEDADAGFPDGESEAPDVPETAPTDPADETMEAPADDAVADPPVDAPVTEAVPDATIADDIPDVSSAVPADDPADRTVADDIPEVSSAVPAAEAVAEEAPGLAATDDPAPPAAAAVEDTAERAEVEETVVTEETARTSAEDFATAIQRQVAPPADADPATLRRDTLQRAIAAGLAGVALGALLDQGNQVAVQSGDRLVLRQDDGDLRLFRDENALLRQPGARVRTETFDDGSTRTTVVREDGTEVVTIRAADGTILRRTRVMPDGREVRLIDDMVQVPPVEVSLLPEPRREAFRYTGDEEALRRALAQAMATDVGRSFTLRQIREIDRVRYLAPEIEIDAITFATASAAIAPDQARQLAALGRTMVAMIEENPGEMFLVEGHTDAVGDAGYNLALSDRRAESLALALTEYFGVPPENLVVQGYGEFDLKIDTQEAERQNRRAVVRRITGLLGTSEAALR